MRIKDRTTIYLYSISVCMGSFVFGYETSSFANLFPLILQENQFKSEDTLTYVMMGLGAVLPLMAIFGASFSRCLVSNSGYLQTFQYIDWLTIAASVIGMLSLSAGVQFVSRVIFGFVTGVNTVIIPTYLTSCLPGSMGGPAGTLNQLFITIGIFFGYLVGFLVVSDSNGLDWRIIVGLPISFALVRMHTTTNVFPYELVEDMLQKQEDRALQVYLDHFFEDVTLEEFKQMKKLPEIEIQSEKAPYFDDAGIPFRRRFNMATFIIFFNQLCGSSTLFTVGPFIFSQVVDWDHTSILTSFCWFTLLQVVVTFISGQFLEKYGRRSFMLEGQRVIIVSLLLFGFIEGFAPELKEFQFILMFVHMIGFSLSFGPCSFLIGTQILYDITFPSMLLWVFQFVVAVALNSIILRYGLSTVIFVQFVISVIGFFYIAGNLVETQGKTKSQVFTEFRGDFPLPRVWNKFITHRGTVATDKAINNDSIQLLPATSK